MTRHVRLKAEGLQGDQTGDSATPEPVMAPDTVLTWANSYGTGMFRHISTGPPTQVDHMYPRYRAGGLRS